MSTADLGLLVIEYLFGNLLLKLPFSHSNPAGRRATIDRADALFNEYLGRCHRCYELIHFQRVVVAILLLPLCLTLLGLIYYTCALLLSLASGY